MKKSNTFVILLSLALAAVVGFSGCRTIDGAGEDVENLGENIQDAAD